jgi:parallel beta-helix repeat protein
MIPPGQLKRRTIVVKPGRSIQEALDRAQEGTRIYVLSGVYKEGGNGQNALEITKSNIRLVGQTNKKKRAILKSTGNQANGIVVVPLEISAAAQPEGRVVEDRTDCMGCHSDMAPPFPLHPDVPIVSMNDEDPWLYNVEIIGITIEKFSNNGLFTEHVDGFQIHDVESIDNRNYGIFPTLSKNGAITDCRSVGSDLDSALWVETSENVDVIGNFVEGSVNGIEVSNSDDIRVYDNEMRNNTIGAAILLLPDIFDNRGSAKRIDLRNNWVVDNNKENTARPGSILSFIPKGIGILYVGVDDSVISGNLVEDHDFVGIAISDYCPPFEGTGFDCPQDPTPEEFLFLLDQTAKRNRVEDNVLIGNATPPPDPENPFGFAQADLTLLTLPFDLGLPPPPFVPQQDPDDFDPLHGNCYENNVTSAETEFFSLWYLILATDPDPNLPDPPPLPWQPPPCDD